MGLLRATRANAATYQDVQELQGHPGSDNIAWIRETKKSPVYHIRGPVWTRGVVLHRSPRASVWITSGPSGGETTVGAGIIIDF